MKIKRKLVGKVSGDIVYILDRENKLWIDNKICYYEMKNGVLIVK